jgi:hypothetical protein
MDSEWKYHITINEPNYNMVQDWCNVYIGEFDVDWYKLGIDPLLWLNRNNSSTWYFKEEKHLIHFKLRWA